MLDERRTEERESLAKLVTARVGYLAELTQPLVEVGICKTCDQVFPVTCLIRAHRFMGDLLLRLRAAWIVFAACQVGDVKVDLVH